MKPRACRTCDYIIVCVCVCLKEWAGQPKSFIWVDFSGSHKLGFSLADSDYLRRRCLVRTCLN